MFSFINFLQSILRKLQKNKGVWFTILTVASVIGVLVSISLMNIMTTDVSKKTYMEVHEVEITQLDNILDTKYDSLLSMGGVIAMDPDVIANIKSKSDKSLNDRLSNIAKNINERVNIDPIIVRYYAKDYTSTLGENTKYADLVMSTTTSISGIVVDSNGIRLIGITPILDANVTIGAIEVSQDVASLRNTFESLGKEFAFILNKSQMVFIGLETKQGNTQDISEKYKIFFHKYNPQFFTNIRKINLEKLQQTKYNITPSYYTTYEEAVNINGKPIGLFIIGESAQEANSFVNITKNLISSVTTVALGLVISLILFMF